MKIITNIESVEVDVKGWETPIFIKRKPEGGKSEIFPCVPRRYRQEDPVAVVGNLFDIGNLFDPAQVVPRPISYEERVTGEEYRNGFTGETLVIGMTQAVKEEMKETFDFLNAITGESHRTMEELANTRVRFAKLTRRLDGVEKERTGLLRKNRAIMKGREEIGETLDHVASLTFWGRLLFLFRGYL